MSNPYPEFVFTGTADGQFKKLIREAVSRISFDSPDFAEWERSVFRTVKSSGWHEAFTLLKQLDGEDHDQLPKEWRFKLNLGNQVFLLAGSSLKPFLLRNDVEFGICGQTIVANFRQLESGRGVLRSPHHPKVVIDGRSYVVGFKGTEKIEHNGKSIEYHAIDRLKLRSAKEWFSYEGHGEIFHLLYDCKYLVGCTIKNNQKGVDQPAFSLFERISGLQSHWRVFKPMDLYWWNVVPDDGSGRFVRIGYLPVDIDGSFANARTFLLPGWRATPEAALYDDNSLPTEIRDRLRGFGEADEPGYDSFHTDPILLRVFHEHGFPQVVLGSDPCFAHLRK